MTPQELNQLIQSLPDWQTSTPEKVWQYLSEKTIKKVDPRKWKSIDLAKLIGWDQVDNFFNYLAQNKCQWVVDLAAGDGLEIGDDPVNAVLRGFNNPVCQQLADLGIHYVSMLEDAGIETTKEIVACAFTAMLNESTIAERKQSLLLSGSVKWNAFVSAVESWNGVGQPPEL